MLRYEVVIEEEKDIVIARQVTREAAKQMKFGIVDQTRIITAVSELSRNIFQYAGKGYVVLEEVVENNKHGLMISFVDEGPGIQDIDYVMQGGNSSGNGMGLGLCGSKRLMDNFSICSQLGKGTIVIIKKWL
ncbi:anti-sigma regulatory factor [Clostridium cylindrosporum]|uniref:Serine/threonine-protein kinase RsbT n=1 Tax=Clostridium cylindrosporum DSM 605 TaxID=1121307 RepID=A0A0J8DCL8_CLOCY|nr:anti-sigma regulatory factor [Clostridium cylindrosporum]KMT21999.1 serine/threonine-protein kinase RsbT [Clostridium cylindrosporum DSM 605]